MTDLAVSVNQTVCGICEVRFCVEGAACDRCGQVAPYHSAAERTAIDLELEHPVLLRVTVSVHHCPDCRHYFRAQPPFLRRDAIYTNRVVDKAVQSVYQDGMAMRRVTDRMARDYWVQPSEATVRGWCRSYGAGFDYERDYQAWVVSEFSGILCVDEVYQDKLALLLAVDPAAGNGDRLVGYQLLHSSVNASDVEQFLMHLKQAGIEPAEVVTDGSQLYPAVLARVWPQAAHQLCLFHETRLVTRAVLKVINTVRKRLPQPPAAVGVRGGGPLHQHPPSDDLSDVATQRWYWRRVQRRIQSAQVHDLAHQGLSLRAIARQTGHHRRTIRRWLRQPIPELPPHMPVEIAESAACPIPPQPSHRKQRLIGQVQALSQQGLSYSAIGRQVGICRVTVKRWLTQEQPTAVEACVTPSSQGDVVPPPDPWSGWDQVREVREALREHRFLLLRRPENLNAEEQQHVAFLLASPVGPELRPARTFLEDWYRLWCDEHGQKRSLDDALARYDAWRTNPTYGAAAPVRRIQQQMTPGRFERLSQFLRDPDWEATSNAAERAGRAFRHRQAPHFNLRTADSINRAMNVSLCLQCGATRQHPPPRCPRESGGNVAGPGASRRVLRHCSCL